MRSGSPYASGSRTMLPFLTGRDELLDNAQKYLLSMAKGLPQRSVIYYGLRGVGKTALLNAIEEKADEMDILYAHIEIAGKSSFVTQIANSSKKIIHAMSNPNDQTFSAGMAEPSPYITTGVLSDDLTDMFVSMGRTAVKSQKVICFFIDEIHYMKENEMEALVNALHRVNQLRLSIMIFGAGLPKVLRILGEVKSYSERLFQYFEVGELSAESAREAIEKPVNKLGVEYTEQANP